MVMSDRLQARDIERRPSMLRQFSPRTRTHAEASSSRHSRPTSAFTAELQRARQPLVDNFPVSVF